MMDNFTEKNPFVEKLTPAQRREHLDWMHSTLLDEVDLSRVVNLAIPHEHEVVNGEPTGYAVASVIVRYEL